MTLFNQFCNRIVYVGGFEYTGAPSKNSYDTGPAWSYT